MSYTKDSNGMESGWLSRGLISAAIEMEQWSPKRIKQIEDSQEFNIIPLKK